MTLNLNLTRNLKRCASLRTGTTATCPQVYLAFIRPPLDGEDMRYVQITPRVRCIGYKVVRAQESCGTTLLNETYKVSSV